MFISYADSETGQILVAVLAPGVGPESAARAMRLAPGAWREITAEEAALPLRPTEAEKIEARRAEVLAELAEIDRQSLRPLRAIVQGSAAEGEAAKLAGLEARAEKLRAELAGLNKVTHA